MDADLAIQIAVWLLVTVLVGGVVYLAHRFTAPFAERLAVDQKQTHYAWLAHRGLAVGLDLPRFRGAA